LQQLPCAGEPRFSVPGFPMVTIDTLRVGLTQLLDASGGSFPLSNIKRAFRLRLHLDLSETALGHAKLCDLLQDQDLADVCEVRLDGNRYMVFRNSSFGLHPTHQPTDRPGALPRHHDLPTLLDSTLQMTNKAHIHISVQNTFLHASLATPSSTRRSRATSLPRALAI